MKSIEHLQVILAEELQKNFMKGSTLCSKEGYYNESFGDTSFLLTGLLQAHLKSRDDWDSKKWLDDSLLSDARFETNKLSIWGVIIWGVDNSTEQWTSPFYFEAELDDSKTNLKNYSFLYEDLNKPEVSYEDFRINRDYWVNVERDWKYIITQKE